MNNEYSEVGLYDHNAISYKKVSEAFEEEDVVAIVHATGTGKTYNALQLAYDNKDKKIIYVVPSHGIIEHIKKIINNNPKLKFTRDFPNLEFRTYQSFINMDEDEISELDLDMLILDEFHHIGAPIWGSRINTVIETHPDIKIFGMTAYTVRERGTSYERDMANPETDEIFSRKVVSRYDLCDAMIDGVLPKPIYKSAYTNLIGMEQALEQRVMSMNATSKEYQEYMAILSDVKKRIHEAPSMSDVVKQNIKPNGKYIYFCPPLSEDGTNDIETIKEEAKRWFLEMGLREEDIVIYTTTSKMGLEGQKNRNAFYTDTDLEGQSVDGKLRVMFAINQYNEGIHAPNVDGVIMGRGTTSDIVYYEQLGRALSVRGNTKEKFEQYEKYSIPQLLELCKKRNISIDTNTPKEEIIEQLIAPTIIDLTNNFEFIKQLEDNLKDRIRDIQALGPCKTREIKIRDASFDIGILNQDLFQMLCYINDKLGMKWERMYEYAKAYYEHHGNLEVPAKFKTNNGYEYDEYGTINLGKWINYQRQTCPPESDRGQLLSQIGMRFERKIPIWEEMYEYAKAFYEHHGHLEVPAKFKTSNGYEYDENGIMLGQWITSQRRSYKYGNLSDERKVKLLQIKMRLEVKNYDKSWQEKYDLAKSYYEHYGNLEIPGAFKTINGYEYDENGINLGEWISGQRTMFLKNKMSSDRIEKLLQIGMRLEVKGYEQMWEEKYELARTYFEYHGNLDIPTLFKTTNGYEYDENGIALGQWIAYQRTKILNGKLTSNQHKKLMQLGIRMEVKNNDKSWEEKYELAKAYYNHYGNLEIPNKFKTINGYEYDENGIALGQWIITQRQEYNSGSLREDRKKQLDKIGMIYDARGESWDNSFELAKKYFEHHGNLKVPTKFKTNNGYEHEESGVSLRAWIDSQRTSFLEGSLTDDRVKKLESIGMRFKVKNFEKRWDFMYELVKIYFEHHGDLDIPLKFKTKNGYEYDEEGEPLGAWLGTQKREFKTNKLKEDRKTKLDKLGIEYEEKDVWYDSYELAKAYYEHHGNLEIPRRFKTVNGYEYDEEGFSLGSWLTKQRLGINRNNIEDDKKKKLLELGLRIEVKDYDELWEEKYELAKVYYEHHGNLRVNPKFKTSNGYEYDENGITLGIWIVKQRVDIRKNKMSRENIEKLLKIGMIVDSKNNKEQLEQICAGNNINVNVNKKIISHISIQELTSKIEFLRENNIPITDTYGRLHEIFSMSNINMQAKYGISIEELISKYYISSKSKGGK